MQDSCELLMSPSTSPRRQSQVRRLSLVRNTVAIPESSKASEITLKPARTVVPLIIDESGGIFQDRNTLYESWRGAC